MIAIPLDKKVNEMAKNEAINEVKTDVMTSVTSIISQTVNNGKRDKSTLRKPVKLQGEWHLDPSKGY
jgi:hypothetical protein